ncbi:Signal peptidase I V [Polystyrenella longa]|uniref:Signal peptidase I n=2 Tax=Polystyrenella longa TaxID=2528007 RepID=A0A518CI84_9PLAN|nr:Signal peptidase I V [Polystyrenella longa]
MSRARHLMEAIVFLALAVVLIRAFQVEGYLITTGSMATALKGAHAQVDCTHCLFSFAVGASFDESSPNPFHQELSSKQEEFTTCPNCGEPRIPLTESATSQGDQILIHKGGFYFREPKRFEPALFRNPDQPHEIYIKRIVGLPGETILLSEGDLFINGARIVKTLTEQRQLRELIHDEGHPTLHDSQHEIRSRWQPARGATTGWAYSADDYSWTLTPTTDSAEPNFQWLQYQHWLAVGGSHLTQVSLPKPEIKIGLPPLPRDQQEAEESETSASLEEPEKIEEQDLDFPFQLPTGGCPVQFDNENHELSIYGVLTNDWYEKVAKLNKENPEHIAALSQLKAQSHLAPITDFSSYNPNSLLHHARVMNDLMISLRLKSETPSGQFALRLHEGANSYEVVFDLARNEFELFLKDSFQPILTHALPAGDFASGRLIELSTFDRHLLLAVDGQLVLDSWTLPFTSAHQSYARTPVEIAGRQGVFNVQDLRLYRDLYYRSDFPDLVRHATTTPYQIGSNQYFMLGDNSMRSWDSRCWTKPGVPRNFLLGRPLIVHLPSQTAPEELGGHRFNIRIPDLARIRLIH